MKAVAKRPQRTAAVDYHLDILRRFSGKRGHMIEMGAIFGTSEERKPYAVEDGIAIVNVHGVLSNEPNWWDETSYPELRDEVSQAVDDPDVRGILLCVNSPGGSTDGAFETADFLAEAGKQKPIWAVADTMAYSAAFLLAVQADKIFVSPKTGGLGSTGVYMMHLDVSEALKKAGYKVTFYSAGKGKTDGNMFEPASKSFEETSMSEINRLYGLFVSAVSIGRGIPEATIIEMGASCEEGQQNAISSGFADMPGMMEDAWLAMAGKFADKPNNGLISAKAGQPKGAGTMLEEKKPAVAETATVDTVAIHNGGLAAGMALATQITQLCTLARQPGKAAAFLKRPGISVEIVTNELMATRADATDQNQIDSRSFLTDGAEDPNQAGGVAPAGFSMSAMVDRRIEESGQKPVTRRIN